MKTSSLGKQIGCWLLVVSLLLGLIPALTTPASAANWNMEYFLKKYSDSHFNLQNNPSANMTVEEFIAIIYAYSYYGDGSSNTPATDKNGKQPSAWCAKYVQAEVEKGTITPSKISWTQPVTVAFAAQFLSRAKGKYSYNSNNLYSFTGTDGLSPDDILYLSVAVDHGLISYTPGMNVSAKIARKDALKYEIPTGSVTSKAAKAADTTHMKETNVYYVADVEDTASQIANLKAAGDDVTMVTVGCGYLQSGGTFQCNLEKPETNEVLSYCQDSGKLALLGIINYSYGGFSNDSVASILSSDAAMDSFVSTVVSSVQNNGFDGVNMGIEITSGGASLRASYSSLLTKLSQALHSQGKLLLTTVGAYFTDEQEAASFYDYKTIGQVSDYVHVILYDDYPDSSYPSRRTYGTMSNIVRIGRVLRYCATAMEPEKVLLGMGSIAIDYDTTAVEAEDITYEEAMSLQSQYGSSLITDSEEDGAHFAYVDESGHQHIVYFETASGVKNRIAMVNRYGLGGSSVYYLGGGHQSMFDVISDQSSYKPEIMTAMEAGLIPVSLRGAYDKAITRAEFCQLIVAFVESYSGQTISEYLQQKNVATSSATFTDTADSAVLAANALGIVNGYGEGTFRPNQTITRQEAATMLSRLANVVGLEEPNASSVNFADLNSVPSWYLDGVEFVSALQDPTNGKRVMGGVGNNKFSPTGSYTREQSIMTLIRLYHVVK